LRFDFGSDTHVDVQGNGAYVAAPPSLHPSGHVYKPANGFISVLTWEGDIVEDLFERLRKIDKKFKPDKLRQPIDVGEILKGVSEGLRDQSALQLSTYYRQKDKTEDETFELLEAWNSKNQPPMNDGQLRKCVHSAFKNEKPYKYKFIELIGESFSKKVEDEAEKLLSEPEIIPFILKATDEIVEEEGNRVSIFLLELVAESLELGGESSTGKNTMLDAVLACFPSDMYIKMTGESDKALRYMKKAPTVYFAERRGFTAGEKAKEESVAEYDIKVALSEGKIVTYVTVKDEDGHWEAQPHETVIRNVLMSTTDVDCTPELKNRIWQSSTDYAPEHVGEVVRRKLHQRTKMPNERIDTSNEKTVLRCAVQKILDSKTWKPIITDYVIPFADGLEQVLSQEPRAARDAEKLMKMTYASALLHQRNRPIVEEKKRKVIVCTPEDLYNALTYCKEAVFGTISGGEQTKWFKQRWQIANEILKAGKLLNASTYMLISGLEKSNAYKWLKRFEDAGLIQSVKERGKVWYTYTSGEWGVGNEKVGGNQIALNLDAFWETTKEWLRKKGFLFSSLEGRKQLRSGEICFGVGGGRRKNSKATIQDLPDSIQSVEEWNNH
jgi:DNA-binding transcriptional ArsR family regulator